MVRSMLLNEQQPEVEKGMNHMKLIEGLRHQMPRPPSGPPPSGAAGPRPSSAPGPSRVIPQPRPPLGLPPHHLVPGPDTGADYVPPNLEHADGRRHIQIYVQTLGRNIDEPDILDNVIKRLLDRGSVEGYIISDSDLYARMNTAKQAHRCTERVDGNIILAGEITIRCGFKFQTYIQHKTDNEMHGK